MTLRSSLVHGFTVSHSSASCRRCALTNARIIISKNTLHVLDKKGLLSYSQSIRMYRIVVVGYGETCDLLVISTPVIHGDERCFPGTTMTHPTTMTTCPLCGCSIRPSRLAQHQRTRCPQRSVPPDVPSTRSTPRTSRPTQKAMRPSLFPVRPAMSTLPPFSRYPPSPPPTPMFNQRISCTAESVPPLHSMGRTAPSPDHTPHRFVDTARPDTCSHFLIDGFDLCFWSPHPTITSVLILLHELIKRDTTFLCVFDINLRHELWRFTSEELFKKLMREVYEPCLHEFPHLFLEPAGDSLASLLEEAERRGCPIISTDRNLIMRQSRYGWGTQSSGIITGTVQRNRDGTVLSIPALTISARGYGKEPTALWRSLRDQLRPAPPHVIHAEPHAPTVQTWEDETPVERVPWSVLRAESPAQMVTQIETYFQREQARKRGCEYDMEWIRTVCAYHPDAIYVGADDFDGYVVFWFHTRHLAVLECPEVGNALYVITGDWRDLSKKNKTQLLSNHAESVTRIIHAGEWAAKLHQVLERSCRVGCLR